MEIHCTRPECPGPVNSFPELQNPSYVKTAQQKYCPRCGMPQILAGRYIPTRLLGRGGFGAAYLASDRYSPTMRQCVVKQFQPPENLGTKALEIAQQLFEREAEALERLGNRHPQIPDLFAFFPLIVPALEDDEEEDQFFYLVQEYIDGQDLEAEREHKGRLGEDEVVDILEQILPVLSFVHENGAIHRDIKPSNIIRDRSGRLHLLDFGAVKQVTASTTVGRSTGIYSMGFAPPEQMAGAQVFPCTDLYALAATCITLATGKPVGELYDSFNNEWKWRSHAEVGLKLARLLDCMLHPAPKLRPQRAQDVLDILHAPDMPQEEAPPPRVDVASATTLQPGDEPPASTPDVQSGEPTRIPPRGDRVENPVPEPTPAPTSVLDPYPQTLPEPGPPSSPPTPRRSQSQFPLLEVLGNAAFTGFEGALLLAGLTALLPAPPLGIGVWGMAMGGLIYAQYRRVIEKIDLPIIGAVTLAIVLLAIPLAVSLPFSREVVVVGALLAGAGAVAVTALFRSIYLLLSRLL